MPFATPIRDMRFTLDHAVGFRALQETGAFEDLSDDLTDAIFTEMAKFADEVIAPMRVASDQQGASLNDGVVTTTPGFIDAYGKFVEGGWNGLSFPTEFGGQGLPFTLTTALTDALNAACMGFAIGITLTQGAIKAVLAHGDERLQRLYLEKMVSGEWSATMNLTEPNAGSDVGALRTKAEPAGDGTYRISGSKIYITYGEHDLTDNIVHLVLARLPGAPEGAAGISLFLVPKFLVGDDGSLQGRNDVKAVGLEHKMGLHGSPTCTMAYGEKGECVGYLVGRENKGLACMFTMMNAARLDVGLQGVGVAEGAFQHALAYAQDRRQGRAYGEKSGPQVPIIEHPDVRRMLYRMKSSIEASRAICYANAVAYDLAHYAPDAEQKRRAKALEELLTPISKAWSTDEANATTSLGVQIHGGMGYVEETGAAQFMRDARIAAIYEGTNGIQAIDLVGRKLPMEGGEVVAGFLEDALRTAADLKDASRPELQDMGARLAEGASALKVSSDWLMEALRKNPNDALAGADAYLQQFGLVAGGHYMGRGALAAARLAEANSGDTVYYRSKVSLAGFFAAHRLSEAAGLTQTVCAGADALAPIEPEALAG